MIGWEYIKGINKRLTSNTLDIYILYSLLKSSGEW